MRIIYVCYLSKTNLFSTVYSLRLFENHARRTRFFSEKQKNGVVPSTHSKS